MPGIKPSQTSLLNIFSDDLSSSSSIERPVIERAKARTSKTIHEYDNDKKMHGWYYLLGLYSIPWLWVDMMTSHSSITLSEKSLMLSLDLLCRRKSSAAISEISPLKVYRASINETSPLIKRYRNGRNKSAINDIKPYHVYLQVSSNLAYPCLSGLGSVAANSLMNVPEMMFVFLALRQ